LSSVQPHEEVESEVGDGVKLKKLPGVTFDSTSCVIVVDKEFKQLIMVSFAYHFFDQHIQTTMVYSTNEISSQC
jgi:hypothetical protein